MGLRATLLLLPATCAALATAPALASPQLEVRAVTGAQAPDAPPGLDFLYFGDAVVKSRPRTTAMVEASWDVVTVTSRRTPKAGTDGPTAANHVFSAAGTSLP